MPKFQSKLVRIVLKNMDKNSIILSYFENGLRCLVEACRLDPRNQEYKKNE